MAHKSNRTLRLALLGLLAVMAVIDASAQTTSTTDGTTPSGIAPGAPSGSYALSNLDNINLYNGNLNFALPLLDIGGRGTAGYEMTLPLNVKSWHVQKIYDRINDAYKYRPNQNQWVMGAGLNPGSLTGRQLGLDYQPTACFGGSQFPNYPTKGITTLTFVSPGETEHELRDVNTNGQPLPRLSCFAGASRGAVFATTDGSSITFVSDTTITDQIITTAQTFYPSGYLLFPNGTRYRIDSGFVSWIRDRNGNQVTFAYDTNNRQSTITDSLGRQVVLTYGGSDPAYYTDITYNGFGGSPRTIRITSVNLSSALSGGFAIQTYGQLFPELYSSYPVDASINLTNNPNVVSSVTLPNGRQYQFLYNSYGELARLVLPTGGAIEYDMVPGSGVIAYSPTADYEIYRRVSERRVYPDGSTGTTFESRTTFAASTNNPFDPKPWYTNVTVDHLNQSGTLLAREKHYFNGSGVGSLFKFFTNVSSSEFYSPWIDGQEFQIEALDTAGNVLRRVTNVWQQRAAVSWWTGNADYAPANDPRISQTVITLEPGGANLVAQETFGYDDSVPYNNRNDLKEYNYGSGAPGALARETRTAYVTSPNYIDAISGAHLRRLPASTTIYDGAGTIVAQSTVSYDEAAYPVLTYGSVTGWADPQTNVRGNPTTTSHWLNTTNSWLQAHAQYDQCGSLRKTWDARDTSLSNPAQIGYSSTYAYAYPTQTTSSVPDSTGGYGSTTSLFATSVYDFNTGLVTSTTDTNGKTTTFEYNDSLNRLTRVNLPDGGATTHTYVDAHQCGAYVEIKTLLDSSPERWTDSWQFFDGLGRPYLAEKLDNQDPANPYLRVDTQYDSMGRAYKVSGPYRSAGCTSTLNPSGRWTQTTFDALSRPTQVLTTADNAAVTTTYTGNTMTVTDQAGKKRRSVSDALGRLIHVDEPDANGNLGEVSNPVQPTSYTYDALGNLRQVTQGGQLRYFMYDSLGRLIRAKNPEQVAGSGASNMTDPVTGNTQWSMAYGYDNNGNLSSRVDARNITTTYGYDALNRNYSVTYSDGTPTIYRYYDSATNGRGRLYWEQAVGVFANVFDAYDAMGRPTQNRQRFWVNGAWGLSFNNTATYDYAGHLLTQAFPSGHVESYGYDIAGRINNYSGNLGDGVSRTYSTGISYSEFGGMQQEQFGTQTAVYHKLHYNVRGQLYDIRASTASWQTDEWNWNRGAILNYYSSNYGWGTSGTDNNGNVTRQQHWIPGNDSITTYNFTEDTFAYDSLNRLRSVTELPGTQAGYGAQSFVQAYSYDRYGNRTIDQTLTTANIPRPAYTVDPNTNRLVAPAGYTMSYDAAGNQYSDAYGDGSGASYSRTYDAESRMTSSTATYSNPYQVLTSNYTYDADGRRIKRLVNGNETWQVYGLGGELLAEYIAGAATFLPTKEYGYRGGELLVTMSSGDDLRLLKFLHKLYIGALGRSPNSTEQQQGMDSLSAAGAQSQSQLLAAAQTIAQSLFNSTEYAQRNRTDAQFVTDLYWAYLQRAPDAGGYQAWLNVVPTSGRAAVRDGFAYSAEFSGLVSRIYGVATDDNQRTTLFVYKLYSALNRDPSSSELTAGINRLNAAAQLGQSQTITEAQTFAREIFNSTEYANRNRSDRDFVMDLYLATVQRAPDNSGWDAWTAAVASSGRAAVREGFLWSGEFQYLAGTLYREEFWLVNDQLGTPRIILDKSGSLAGVKRHDYLPFGEELFAGTGGRTQAQGYSANDGVRQKFTQKERDNETGLDYFLARYYSSMQGRFTSPDDFLNDTKVADPASWNLYVYVRNNPLRLIDPTGEVVNGDGLTDQERQQLIEDWKKKTGYNNIYFDKKNNLVIDHDSGIAKDANGKFLGSADARANLTDAIETKDVFNLEHANGSSKVAFADNELTQVTTNTQTHETFRTYRVRIDFSDFKHQSGDREAIEANSIGLVVLHEIDHNLYGHIEDYPSGPNDPGAVENNYINPIREQLGLAQRATYDAKPITGPLRDVYRGYVQVRYTLNGKDKMLRWQDMVVGGVHH